MKMNIKDLCHNSNKILLKCRICLQEGMSMEQGVDLFSETKLSKEIRDKIFMCTQIIFTEKECLPKMICKICLGELDFANTFRLKCLLSDTTLMKYSDFIGRNPDVENSSIWNCCDENSQDAYMSPSNKTVVSENNQDCLPSETVKEELDEFIGHKCNVCGKILKKSSSLRNHIASMHQNKKIVGRVTGHGITRLHHCIKCSYTTKRGQSLAYHMRTHTGEKPFSCHCGKKFSQPASLATHQKTHSEETSYTCPKCGKQFKYKQSYKNHQRVHEAGTFVCSICEKVVKSSDTLKSHMQRHYNIRNYNCDECGCTFVTSAELINHKKKHKRIKTFECNLCDYKTYLKKVLIIHLKRHSGERLYQCNICEFSFYTNGDLKRHKRRHTREKLYSCPVCEQKFMHSSSVNKHVRNVHRSQYKWNDDVDRTTVKPVVDENKAVQL